MLDRLLAVPVDAVKEAALRGLQAMLLAPPTKDPVRDNLIERVWEAKCDLNTEYRELY